MEHQVNTDYPGEQLHQTIEYPDEQQHRIWNIQDNNCTEDGISEGKTAQNMELGEQQP